jgi:hypothetical protein
MPAPALRELQASFWRSLHGGEADPALTAVVPPTPTLDPAARIDVYQGMYVRRLHEVLREDFPKLAEALGDELETLTRGYLARHPSVHPSVRHLGTRLAEFLETDAVARTRPWLPDLARLERARVDAFDAPDAVPLRASDLAAVPPEAWADLRFEMIPALDVLRSRWPIHAVWAAPLDAPAARPTVLRVWRQDFTVFHAALDDVEDAAFAAVRRGETFGAVCEVVAEYVEAERAAAEAGALLVRWIEDGLVARAG